MVQGVLDWLRTGSSGRLFRTTPCGSVEGGGFLEHLRNHQLLKYDSFVPCVTRGPAPALQVLPSVYSL
jgi:hypothetical protein